MYSLLSFLLNTTKNKQMTDYAKAFQMLFQSPLEPIYTCRDNGKCIFELPDSHYMECDGGVKEMLQERYANSQHIRFALQELPSKPDLSFADKLSVKQNFSLFNTLHKEIAGKLIRMLMEAEDLDNFLSLCVYSRHRLNAMLFQYCYSVALLHRRDTRGIWVPPVAEIFPANFIEPSAFTKMRKALEFKGNKKPHVQIPHNYTASDREIEQRLAYFREDIGVNMHHWHWHLVYPNSGTREIINKDRRGELFYYMHQQILARYNAERFSNKLAKALPLSNLREPIEEGYYPKLLDHVHQRTYPGRSSNLCLQDVNREDTAVEIADMERWADRILAAIDQGFVIDSHGNKYQLDEVTGIDILGNIIEESDLSINVQYYGKLHNMGHNSIASIHDPDHRHMEEFGVIGHNMTAMRDPVFYRWHTYINNIMLKFKRLLPPYSEQQLSFSDINLREIEVRTSSLKEPNHFETFWQNSEVDLAAGLDFTADSGLHASYTHLQHAPFEYCFVVENNSEHVKCGTCRIFLCPIKDDRGKLLKLEGQRLLAIELDKFTVKLYPGENQLKRLSVESSVTIDVERTFGRTTNKDALSEADPELNTRLHFCGCGWPHYMLLPKGKIRGMRFDLFVMISDYADDAVQQPGQTSDCHNCEGVPNEVFDENSTLCNDNAASFCGLRDKLYPDKRTMGYPFDRRLPADTLNGLVEQFGNMQRIDVTITFNDEVRSTADEVDLIAEDISALAR
ncbi:phenoloxidase 2-like [Bactrocera neohumeralis]|uniref:phenoloxidase 2-like n=1 Tax=Bactrocera neohumeralis TaxID=98809 RepID=UPI0021653805|nr:phenoloxidase 2-like [Bactrocera neohumeralis]